MFYIRFRDLNDFSSFPDFLFLYFFTLYNRPAPHQILVDGSDLFFFCSPARRVQYGQRVTGVP